MNNTFTFLSAVCVILAASCQPKTSENAARVSDTASTSKLSVEVAKEYVSNYLPHSGYVVDSTKTDSLGNPEKKPDTRCIWFSAKQLEKLLAQLKEQKGDGIRFYLMTYNTHYEKGDHKYHPIPPKEYWGYNSLLMVSTKDSTANGITYHRDFYKDQLNQTDKKGFLMNIDPENRGELCPPPQNCGKTGATLITN